MVLRSWDPADAALLKDAIDSSLEHLRRWMPWAEKDPDDFSAIVQWLRACHSKFDLGQHFNYGIFDLNELKVLGSIDLHSRIGEGGLEIGYWIHKSHINQDLATEAVAALTWVAFEVNQVNRIEIHCIPENHRSAAVPRKLGVDTRQPYDSGD